MCEDFAVASWFILSHKTTFHELCAESDCSEDFSVRCPASCTLFSVCELQSVHFAVLKLLCHCNYNKNCGT